MKRIVSVLLIAVLLILTAACGAESALHEETFDQVSEQTTPMTFASLHTRPADAKKLKKIAAGGIVELYVDPVTFSASVRETISGQYWHTLPPYIKGQSDAAAPITLTVRKDGVRNHWNVQENSVAFGKAKFEKLADGTGIVVTYDCYPSLEEAKNPMPSLAFRIGLRYTLADGSLVVHTSWDNLAPNSGAVLESIGVLESFGAYDKSDADDFLLLPDGSGAVVKTAKADTNFTQPLLFQVYGQDIATPTQNYAYSAILPVFGVRHGKSGFAAFIEQGDAIASIVADRRRSGNAINSVGTRFDITPTVLQAKGKKTVVYSAAESYKDPIVLRYRFLSGGAADYSGMAGALREQLIRSKLIPSHAVENQDKLPINITLTATARVKHGIEYTKTLTTTEQVQELLTLLKGKGIDNVNIQLVGATERRSSVQVLTRVGGNAEYVKLQEIVRAQDMQLFLDIPYLTGSGGQRAQNLYGKTIKLPRLSTVSALYDTKVKNTTLRATENLEKSTTKILLSLRSIDPMGLSLSDLDAALCSDYSAGAHYNRQKVAEEIQKQLAPLSTDRKLMVPGGNFYLLRNASVVTQLPSSARAMKESAAYVSVPLAPMLLHGVVDYSFEPLNFEENTDKAMDQALLKTIEYGALPAFSWVAGALNSGDAAADKLDYDSFLSLAARSSETCTEGLANLRGLRITRHTVYQAGVTGTEYESGTIIYVNASGKDAKVNGLTIKTNSFLRVN
ncbi:MAG: DUF5696 domain-containing protein [Oscillospiraceae bacterium]|jgi:hypothetical protein|nr:DUF5696 domain-containing protein [Oscillospiraceae bacterium]